MTEGDSQGDDHGNEGDTTPRDDLAREISALREAYAAQGEILRNVVKQQRNVDETMFDGSREPRRMPGVKKEFESLKKMLFELKREANELEGGEDDFRRLEKFIVARLKVRMEYLYTTDAFGEEAANHFLIIAEGETDPKELVKCAAKAAKAFPPSSTRCIPTPPPPISRW